MHCALRLLAGACFLLPLQRAVAAAEPADWLVQVSAAARSANYQGTLVYRDEGNRLETLRIVHRLKNDREQERITSLNGRQRDIFREDGRVVSVLAEEPLQQLHTVFPEKLMPALTADTLRQLSAHYDVRDLGTGRVASRASRGVEIAPRDGYRYGYQIWADAASAVPLKVTLLTAHGRVLEQVMFTEIDYPAKIQDTVFAPPPEAERVAPVEVTPAKAAAAPAAGWQLGAVPAGFEVILRTVQPIRESEDVVEQVQLSDGLSAVSIFSARLHEPSNQFSGYSSLGAMNAYARRVGAYHVTVVGEVPRSTVRMIGDGVRPADASNATTPASATP